MAAFPEPTTSVVLSQIDLIRFKAHFPVIGVDELNVACATASPLSSKMVVLRRVPMLAWAIESAKDVMPVLDRMIAIATFQTSQLTSASLELLQVCVPSNQHGRTVIAFLVPSDMPSTVSRRAQHALAIITSVVTPSGGTSGGSSISPISSHHTSPGNSALSTHSENHTAGITVDFSVNMSGGGVDDTSLTLLPAPAAATTPPTTGSKEMHTESVGRVQHESDTGGYAHVSTTLFFPASHDTDAEILLRAGYKATGDKVSPTGGDQSVTTAWRTYAIATTAPPFSIASISGGGAAGGGGVGSERMHFASVHSTIVGDSPASSISHPPGSYYHTEGTCARSHTHTTAAAVALEPATPPPSTFLPRSLLWSAPDGSPPHALYPTGNDTGMGAVALFPGGGEHGVNSNLLGAFDTHTLSGGAGPFTYGIGGSGSYGTSAPEHTPYNSFSFSHSFASGETPPPTPTHIPSHEERVLSAAVGDLRRQVAAMHEIAASKVGGCPLPLAGGEAYMAEQLTAGGNSMLRHAELAGLPDTLRAIADLSFGDKSNGGGEYGGGGGRSRGNTEPIRWAMFQSGVVSHLLECIQTLPIVNSEDRQTLEYAIQSVTNVAFNKVAQAAIGAPHLRAVPILLARMRLDSASAEIQLKLARCLSTLAYDNPASQQSFVFHRGIELVVGSISRHLTHTFAVEKLLGLLLAVKTCADVVPALHSAGMPALLDRLLVSSWLAHVRPNRYSVVSEMVGDLRSLIFPVSARTAPPRHVTSTAAATATTTASATGGGAWPMHPRDAFSAPATATCVPSLGGVGSGGMWRDSFPQAATSHATTSHAGGSGEVETGTWRHGAPGTTSGGGGARAGIVRTYSRLADTRIARGPPGFSPY